MLLLFTDISPACHILWNNRDSLSRIELPDSSEQLLYTKRLITREMSKWISLSDYSLSRDELRGIYAAVDNDHEKLRDFAEILLLSHDTSSLAVDLLNEYCKYRVYCKTTNFSVLLILAILVNGIKTLILIPANIYNQSRGRTR